MSKRVFKFDSNVGEVVEVSPVQGWQIHEVISIGPKDLLSMVPDREFFDHVRDGKVPDYAEKLNYAKYEQERTQRSRFDEEALIVIGTWLRCPRSKCKNRLRSLKVMNGYIQCPSCDVHLQRRANMLYVWED